jgi:hypothetical protein
LAVKLTPQGPDQAVNVDDIPPIHGSATVAGAVTAMSCGCPDSIRDMSGSGPPGPIINGVWQSLQSPIVTKYSPRFTCSFAALS